MLAPSDSAGFLAQLPQSLHVWDSIDDMGGLDEKTGDILRGVRKTSGKLMRFQKINFARESTGSDLKIFNRAVCKGEFENARSVYETMAGGLALGNEMQGGVNSLLMVPHLPLGARAKVMQKTRGSGGGTRCTRWGRIEQGDTDGFMIEVALAGKTGARIQEMVDDG